MTASVHNWLPKLDENLCKFCVAGWFVGYNTIKQQLGVVCALAGSCSFWCDQAVPHQKHVLAPSEWHLLIGGVQMIL